MNLFLSLKDPVEGLGSEPVFLCDTQRDATDRRLEIPASLVVELRDPVDMPPGRWFYAPASTVARILKNSASVGK